MNNNGKILKAAIFGAIISAFASFGSANAANAQPATSKPLPGYWEFQTKAAGIFNDSDRYCLSQSEIDRFYANPCKKNTVCTYSTKSFKPDGTVALVGTWVDKKQRSSKVRGNGTFRPDNLKLKISVNIFGSPIPISGTFEAKRIGATCRK